MNIADAINEMPVIDNHSHAGFMEAIVGTPLDLEDMLNIFAKADIQSLMPDEEFREILRNPDGFQPHQEELKKYQEARVNTVYDRLQLHAYRELHGHQGESVIGPDGEALSHVIREHRKKGMEATYEEIFRRSNIERALVNDTVLLVHLPEKISWIPYIDQFVFIKDNTLYRKMRFQLERTISRYETSLVNTKKALGADPTTFKQFLEFIDAALRYFRQSGCPAMKLHCAYVRSLRFEEVTQSKAQELYKASELTHEEYTELQDFLMRFSLQRCLEHNLPVQVHAAMGGPTPGLILSNANCCNLQNLFLDDRLRQLRFVILHGGYPFFREAGYFACNYANVYLDFSWLTFFFQSALTRILEELLELVPYKKLLFATDAWTPELYWCGVTNGKRILTQVLERGNWSERISKIIAHSILYDNAKQLYRL